MRFANLLYADIDKNKWDREYSEVLLHNFGNNIISRYGKSLFMVYTYR